MPDGTNNSISTATNVDLNDRHYSEIDYSGDTDFIEVYLTAGHNYIVSLSGLTVSNTTLDPYLRGIYNSNGNLLPDTTNDDGGHGRDSIVSFTPTTSGYYYIELGAYGNSVGHYEFSILANGTTTLPPSPASASASTGEPILGLIDEPNERDTISVELEEGEQYGFFLFAALNDGYDPYIRGIYNSDGNLLPNSQNDDGGGGTNSFVLLTAPETGTYSVSVGAFGSTTGAYVFLYAGPIQEGSEDDDTLSGTTGGDFIYGYAGDDELSGYAGNDILYGGEGNDIFYGGSGDDLIYTGGGNDIISGGSGGDYIEGSASYIDFVTYETSNSGVTVNLTSQDLQSGGHAENDILVDIDGVVGSIYNDALYAGYTDSWLFGHNGNDILSGFRGHDVIDGGPGNDILRGNAGSDLMYGGAGNDKLWAGSDDDSDDFSSGGAGNDTLSGAAGDDILIGGGVSGTADDANYGITTDGNDQIFGGSGNDTLVGGGWDDGEEITTGTGTDAIWGGTGNDLIYAASGNDNLGGGLDNDTIYAAGGNDTVYGGQGTGADNLNGGAGNDLIFSGSGNDTINGGDGSDNLFSGGDNDIVDAGAGNDTLWGGGGDDQFTGGNGNDLFYFAAGHGNDTITDFNTSDDTLDLSGTTTNFNNSADVQAAAINNDDDVIIDLGNNDSLTLENMSLSDLSSIIYIF